MRKIVVNGRSLHARTTGVQRYLREVILEFDSTGVDYECARPPSWANSGPAGHLWEQTMLPAMSLGKTLWNPTNTGPLCSGNQVVTIHDAAVFDVPDCFSDSFRRWYQFMLPRLGRSASAVLCPSQFTKERLVERLQLPADRVHAIPNGVSSHFFGRERATELPEIPTRYQKYVITAGSLEPRKNLRTLISAWSHVVDTIGDQVCLAVVGSVGSSRVFAGGSALDDSPHIIPLGYVADDRLAALYASAAAFVSVSRYEGFGLPVLEAMAAGTPVVCSAIPPYREIAAEYGEYVDPDSPDSIAQGIINVLGTPRESNNRIPAGIERARLFSWQASANRTLNTIREI